MACMSDMQVLHRPTKQSIFYPDPPQGPIWGGKPHAKHHRNAPSINSYGAPVDSWVIHCSAVWSLNSKCVRVGKCKLVILKQCAN